MHLVPDPEFFFLQMIPFVVLLLALNLLVFKPMLEYLDERKRRGAGYIQVSRKIRVEADDLKTEYERRFNEARTAILADRAAFITAARDQEKALSADARVKAENQILAFRQELDGVRQRAAATLRKSAQGLSVNIAAKVLGRPIV